MIGDAGVTQVASRPETRQTLFSKDYFKLLREDIAEVFTSPARWERKEWTVFSAAIIGIGSLALLDRLVWDFMRRNRSNPADNVAGVLSDIGGVYSVGLLVPFYVAGLVWDNEKAVSVALDAWSASLIAAGMIAPALKFVAGRSAPDADKGTYDFHPFSWSFQFSGGPQSFPSGHAAQGFAIASVIASHYREPWIKALAYGVASPTSTARLYQGEHFLSDWAAGALIGTFVGTTVVHYNEKRRAAKKEPAFYVMPFLISGGGGLAIIFKH